MHYPCGKFSATSCSSLCLSLLSRLAPAEQKPDAIKHHHWKIQLVSGAGHRNESTAWFLICPTPQHHISQLKPFHGHRSRGNWKSMADWLRPLVINFPSLAGLRDQHPHLCCVIALVSPWRVVDQGVEVTVVLSSCFKQGLVYLLTHLQFSLFLSHQIYEYLRRKLTYTLLWLIDSLPVPLLRPPNSLLILQWLRAAQGAFCSTASF